MNVLEDPVYIAAALALTDEVQGYYREHGFLTEGGCWDRLVRQLSATLQVEVRGTDLEELLDEIKERSTVEDDRAELEWRVGDPEYGPEKADYLAHCDELINENCRQILWPRFVPAPLPAWPVAA
jgi:hypothetical protein